MSCCVVLSDVLSTLLNQSALLSTTLCRFPKPTWQALPLPDPLFSRHLCLLPCLITEPTCSRTRDQSHSLVIAIVLVLCLGEGFSTLPSLGHHFNEHLGCWDRWCSVYFTAGFLSVLSVNLGASLIWVMWVFHQVKWKRQCGECLASRLSLRGENSWVIFIVHLFPQISYSNVCTQPLWRKHIGKRSNSSQRMLV